MIPDTGSDKRKLANRPAPLIAPFLFAGAPAMRGPTTLSPRSWGSRTHPRLGNPYRNDACSRGGPFGDLGDLGSADVVLLLDSRLPDSQTLDLLPPPICNSRFHSDAQAFPARPAGPRDPVSNKPLRTALCEALAVRKPPGTDTHTTHPPFQGIFPALERPGRWLPESRHLSAFHTGTTSADTTHASWLRPCFCTSSLSTSLPPGV
jgi:hypothetical protein